MYANSGEASSEGIVPRQRAPENLDWLGSESDSLDANEEDGEDGNPRVRIPPWLERLGFLEDDDEDEDDEDEEFGSSEYEEGSSSSSSDVEEEGGVVAMNIGSYEN
jgi:hypothetical protein